MADIDHEKAQLRERVAKLTAEVRALKIPYDDRERLKRQNGELALRVLQLHEENGALEDEIARLRKMVWPSPGPMINDDCQHLLRMNGVCVDCNHCDHMFATDGICTHCDADVRKNA